MKPKPISRGTSSAPVASKIKYALLCCFFALNAFWCDAQVTFVFDQETKGIELFGSNWKAGELLTVRIRNYQINSLKYVITYTSDEKVNTNGLALFNRLANPKPQMEYAPNEHTYLLIPIASKDYSHITVTEYNGDTKSDEQTYTFRVHGGLKFDVSTGFFASGLRDEEYVLVKASDSTNTIVTEKTGNFRVGAGVLAHLHSRWSGPLNLGVSGGFEINNEAKVGYLAGGSVFFGYDQKFVLSGGIVLGKQEVLSEAYAPGQEVDDAISIVPLTSIWKDSWFLALTYNF